MKATSYIVLERIVCQRIPEVYQVESSFVAHKQMTQLLENSRRSWSDIEMVYQLCERRQYAEGKKKGKTMASIKVSNDTWQSQMADEENYDDYGDDFM